MGRCALIVIDMFNTYDHEDGDALAANVEPIVGGLAVLVAQARERDEVEIVYVNDSYGDFAATRDTIIDAALHGRRPDLVEPLVPEPGCAFLQKVRHSAFYSTTLSYLVRQREIETLILTGQVTEQCILYTALDAYVRHFAIRVPADAVAPIDRELGDAALRMMQRNMRAEIVSCAEVFTQSAPRSERG